MSIDLHLHSNASDGTLAPVDLVREAARIGLRAVAVTDHDSVEGVGAAMGEGERQGISVVPAVELSAIVADRDVHILGYRINHTDGQLLARLDEFRDRRRERALRMIEALREADIDVDVDDVMRKAGNGAVGRAHIARALIDRGEADSMTDAFERLIGHDRPYFVAKPPVSAEEVIAIIRNARGIPVLAHPAVSRADDLIAPLVSAGLRGIEAWHSEHTCEDVERYRSIARARGLLVTGGTDYHGPRGRARIGSVEVPDDVYTTLMEAERV